jgi:exopolysaccharide biosynthesis polyprenyl glycosylphosphotransferase
MSNTAATQQKERNKPVYHVEPVEPRMPFGYAFLKRASDILVAILVAVLGLLPMAVIAVCIKLDSKGPVVFKQERLGKDGKSFTMYKFRSMYTDAEADGPKWADKEDDRCTKVGCFLRKTRLDELPQFWNILKGEMSLVGPRPERPFFYDEFETYIHGFRNRLVVRPGLTGWAQVSGGYDLKPEEKIVFDMEYIAKMSVRMDLRCLVRTVRLIFTHEGAR